MKPGGPSRGCAVMVSWYSSGSCSGRSSLGGVIALSFAISTAGLAATKTVVYDDFEVAPTTWAFRSMGNTGSQIVPAESAHQGKQSLQSEAARRGMENLRGGFRCR